MNDFVTDVIETEVVKIRGYSIPLIQEDNREFYIKELERAYLKSRAIIVMSLLNGVIHYGKVSPIYTKKQKVGPHIYEDKVQPSEDFVYAFPVEVSRRVIGVLENEVDLSSVEEDAYFLLFSIDKTSPSIIAINFSALLSRDEHPDGHVGRVITICENQPNQNI